LTIVISLLAADRKIFCRRQAAEENIITETEEEVKENFVGRNLFWNLPWKNLHELCTGEFFLHELCILCAPVLGAKPGREFDAFAQTACQPRFRQG
jgi:hypothetical protein